MKFTDGYWHMRPAITPHFPIQVNDVEIDPDALTIYGATKRLNTRGDTLNLPLLWDKRVFPIRRPYCGD